MQVVLITNSAFLPTFLTLHVGGSVRWVNQDGIAHTATPTQGGFQDTGQIGGHQTATRYFSVIGRFPFVCTIHPQMRAEVTVVGD